MGTKVTTEGQLGHPRTPERMDMDTGSTTALGFSHPHSTFFFFLQESKAHPK